MTQPAPKTEDTSATAAKTETAPSTAPASTTDTASKTDTAPAVNSNADKPEEKSDFARLGVNADVSDYVEYGGYRENEDYRPNPHFQYGTLDTSDTAGAAHQNIREVSPVFDVGRAQALALAARALDPNDTEVDSSLVTLPEENLTADEARKDLAAKLDDLKTNKIVVGGMTAEQRAAATDADGNVATAPKGEDAEEEKTSAGK
jgi:hypothetical protein